MGKLKEAFVLCITFLKQVFGGTGWKQVYPEGDSLHPYRGIHATPRAMPNEASAATFEALRNSLWLSPFCIELLLPHSIPKLPVLLLIFVMFLQPPCYAGVP